VKLFFYGQSISEILRRGESMARGKNTSEQGKITISVEVPSGSDLPERMKDVSEYTGLSYVGLLQKWLAREEDLIAILQRREEGFLKRVEAQMNDSKTKNSAPTEEYALEQEENGGNYRQKVIQRITDLREQGMTFSGIARLFNEEGFSTVSGSGKWHSASISQLLNAKTRTK
jgi:hypothetical protein